MSRSVPLVGRVLDAVFALLFFGGAVLYGWAWLGLRDQRALVSRPAGDAFSFAAVERVENLHRLSNQGLALMGIGAVVAVVAAVAARRAGSESEDPSP